MKKQGRFLSFFMAFAIFATSLFTFNLNSKAAVSDDAIFLPKGGSIVVDNGSMVDLSNLCDDDYSAKFFVTYFTSSDMKDYVSQYEDWPSTVTVSNSYISNVSKWVVIDNGDYTVADSTSPITTHTILIYPYSYDATTLPQGESFKLSSNSVLNGYDNFDVSIYCGDELLGEKTSTSNLRLPSDDELNSSYSSLLGECGYNFPTATNLYYNCEVESSDNDTCKLKLTLVPTHKISLKYPEELNMDNDTVYYVTDSVPVNLNNIKIKPCDGYEYSNDFKESSDYYNRDLGTYVFAFTEDTDLNLDFSYAKPTIKLDTDNKTISGFVPNTNVVDSSNSDISFTVDDDGKITYTDDDLNYLENEKFIVYTDDEDSTIYSSDEFSFKRDINVIPMIAEDGEGGYTVTNSSDFEGQDVLFSWNGAESSSTLEYSPSDSSEESLTVTYNQNDNGFENTQDFTFSDSTLLNNDSDTTDIIAGPYDQEYFGHPISGCGLISNIYNSIESYSNKTTVGPSTFMTYSYIGNYDNVYKAFLKYEFYISSIDQFKIESQNADRVFHAGSTQKLTTTLTGEYFRDNKITYSVVGNNDSTTTVSDDGTLTVGENETADSLTVIANYTPMKFKVATLTLVNKPLTSQTISSDDENISLTGNLSTDSQLKVSEIADTDSDYSSLLEDAGNGTVLGCYDITPSAEYEGDLTLSFNVGDEYNGETLNLYHKKSDDTIEKLTGDVENGVVSFTVTSFSPFMLATLPTSTDDIDDTTDDTTTDTSTDTSTTDTSTTDTSTTDTASDTTSDTSTTDTSTTDTSTTDTSTTDTSTTDTSTTDTSTTDTSSTDTSTTDTSTTDITTDTTTDTSTDTSTTDTSSDTSSTDTSSTDTSSEEESPETGSSLPLGSAGLLLSSVAILFVTKKSKK